MKAASNLHDALAYTAAPPRRRVRGGIMVAVSQLHGRRGGCCPESQPPRRYWFLAPGVIPVRRWGNLRVESGVSPIKNVGPSP
jgi:hypothetical protein